MVYLRLTLRPGCLNGMGIWVTITGIIRFYRGQFRPYRAIEPWKIDGFDNSLGTVIQRIRNGVHGETGKTPVVWVNSLPWDGLGHFGILAVVHTAH